MSAFRKGLDTLRIDERMFAAAVERLTGDQLNDVTMWRWSTGQTKTPTMVRAVLALLGRVNERTFRELTAPIERDDEPSPVVIQRDDDEPDPQMKCIACGAPATHRCDGIVGAGLCSQPTCDQHTAHAGNGHYCPEHEKDDHVQAMIKSGNGTPSPAVQAGRKTK